MKSKAAFVVIAITVAGTNLVHAMSPYGAFSRTILHSGTANAPAPGQTTTNQYGQKGKAPSAPQKTPAPAPKK
jgi:hypothetical protein